MYFRCICISRDMQQNYHHHTNFLTNYMYWCFLESTTNRIALCFYWKAVAAYPWFKSENEVWTHFYPIYVDRLPIEGTANASPLYSKITFQLRITISNKKWLASAKKNTSLAALQILTYSKKVLSFGTCFSLVYIPLFRRTSNSTAMSTKLLLQYCVWDCNTIFTIFKCGCESGCYFHHGNLD